MPKSEEIGKVSFIKFKNYVKNHFQGVKSVEIKNINYDENHQYNEKSMQDFLFSKFIE